MLHKLFPLTAIMCLLAGFCVAQGGGHARYVDPMIGTAVQGHTYPGAAAPFGMVQVSPETGNVGWNYCAGYHYEDKAIMGFSHTHLSGTGWMDLGDLLIMPFTGDARKNKIKSAFSHRTEKAEAGYYSVQLDDYGVNAELTATPHSAYHRYRFKTREGKLLINLKHGIVPDSAALQTHVVKSELKIESSNTLSGFIQTKGWAGNKHVYFVMRFKQPFTSVEWLSDSTAGSNHQVVLTFKDDQHLTLDSKVALSTVDVDGAKSNLDSEISGWDFDALRKSNYNKWDRPLSTVEIDADETQKRIFYTALYHNMVVPNNIADVDGRYRGANNNIAVAQSGKYYSTLSLWDTFRATNSLYCLLYPKVSNGIVQTMLAHYQVRGILPIWTLWGHENFGMIGNHAIPVIAEAYAKGIRDYDVEKAFNAVKASSTINHNKSDWATYLKYGYYPTDIVKNESVSRTLESAYDDACVAKMATLLGKKTDYQQFNKRAAFYKNVFNPSNHFMQGRKADGRWDEPFDPLRFSHASTGGNYTEGNAWPYLWHVMHDVPGLIDLFGNKDRFSAKLDSMFSMASPAFSQGARGLIGQYVHGNEPSHHVAYLYNYTGESYKTQELVHRIKATLYQDTPAGLCGNDDCGQMSAWYIFSAMGFYPVDPVSGQYIFGTPSYKKVTLNTGVKQFVITAKNVSATNIYIQQVRLNGKLHTKGYIAHNDILKGGNLEFIMGAEPARMAFDMN